jgi:SMI1 / KNR4 family (SUKH-1)
MAQPPKGTKRPEADENLDQWRALHEKCQVIGDDRTSLHRPTAEELDGFEADTGVKLPAGYRGFLRVFGPGVFEFSRYVIAIKGPYSGTEPSDLRTALERCERLRNERWMDAQLRRLIIFTHNGLGNEFGWDPEEATNPQAPEFAVYAWYRDDTPVKMSNTFLGFIKVCLDTRACLEHMRRKVYKADAAESDLGVLDGLPGRVFKRYW